MFFFTLSIQQNVNIILVILTLKHEMNEYLMGKIIYITAMISALGLNTYNFRRYFDEIMKIKYSQFFLISQLNSSNMKKNEDYNA